MAFTKLTNSDFTNKGVSSLPNQPKIGATALKAKFDELSTDVITPAFNNHIDELEATTAAESIGIVAPEGRGTSENIQGVVDKISLDLSQLEGSFGSITEEIAELEGEIEAAGDMQKSDYDSNDDGVVNSADTLNGLIVGVDDLNDLDGIRSNVQDQLDGKLGHNNVSTGEQIELNDDVIVNGTLDVNGTFSAEQILLESGSSFEDVQDLINAKLGRNDASAGTDIEFNDNVYVHGDLNVDDTNEIYFRDGNNVVSVRDMIAAKLGRDDASTGGLIQFNDDTSITGGLGVTGDASVGGDAEITGSLTVGNRGGYSAVGLHSMVVGYNADATGDYSVADGLSTMALGDYSHASGFSTLAAYEAQTVVGKDNDNKSDTLFEVGNGVSSGGVTVSSNAFEVYNDGSLSTDNGTTKVKLENLVEKYIEQTTYSDSGTTRTFSFSDARITANGRYDYYCDVYGKSPSNVTVSSGSMTVAFLVSDGVTKCGVTIK